MDEAMKLKKQQNQKITCTNVGDFDLWMGKASPSMTVNGRNAAGKDVCICILNIGNVCNIKTRHK